MSWATLGAALGMASIQASPAPAVQYIGLNHAGGYMHAVSADLSSNRASVETVASPRLTSAWRLIGQSQPTAAVTGTFFAWCTQRPIAEVMVDGERMGSGRIGTVFAVDWYGNARLFDSQHLEKVDWFPYRFALRGGVRLLKGGEVAINPGGQRFTNGHFWRQAKRTAVGVSADDRVVIAATRHPVTLREMATGLRRLGVRDAMALDGGGSSMFYYRGRMLMSPNRNLSNLLVVHERPPRGLGGSGTLLE